MKTLQNLLSMKVTSEDASGNTVEVTPNFRVAVQSTSKEGTHIIVHPIDHNGDTLDLLVNGNTLTPLGTSVPKALDLNDDELRKLASALGHVMGSRDWGFYSKKSADVFNSILDKVRDSAKGREKAREILRNLGDDV